MNPRLLDCPVSVVEDAIRAVEDAIDAHHNPWPGCGFDGDHAQDVLNRLLELGWRPPVTP